MSKIRVIFLTFISLLISACQIKVPDDITPVNHFDAARYLGKWYEIARLDNKFEKNMVNVSANYSLRDDNGIKVVNRGFDNEKQVWQESIGRAYFLGATDVAALKVSFFGPFYGGYNVVKLDKDYQVALIAGSNKEYLWILARTPCISDELKTAYVEKAKEIGFDINKLNFNIQTSCTVQ